MKFFTREESRSFDNFLMSEYSIPGIILMENAGAGAARILLQNYSKKTFYIFCGKGNNGGDGFVIARHLWNAGCSIKIFYIGNPTTINTKSDSGINFQIVQKMQLPLHIIQNSEDLLLWKNNDFICVDAIFGTGLQGDIKEPIFSIIQTLKSWEKTSVAIDIPSGLDANTGEILGTVLPASHTITFVYPKIGFKKNPDIVGKVDVVKIF
ncbi:MAG: NAD(P)H-hydrate epimerase [Planctomycetes bacterium]|jgi:NAD(P)H-hydrate epimerase|nr:NAD(P)H-hydrate epimerase [Planctomycetota bacterium]HRU52473.1 NAD(P)H-hydrate epimerase [Planctomycetota bacterium]